MKMSNLTKVFMFTIATLLSQAAWSEVAIVVNPENPINSITKDEVVKIFLGKTNKFPNGDKATPVDQTEGNSIRDEFYSKVVNKTPSQLNSYWSRLIFTGKGQPPKAVEDDEEMLEEVNFELDTIGYVDASAVDSRVKVILTVP